MNFAEPGQPAPDFSLITVEGKTITLHDLLQTRQPIVLVFLRHLG